MKKTKLAQLMAAAAMLAAAWALPAAAQFAGRPGDVVIYAVTYGGSADLKLVPPSSRNTPDSVARFQVKSLDSVPLTSGDPFPLQRQIMYATPTETFQIGIDYENTFGLHRLFIKPVKIFQFDGLTNPFFAFLGNPNTFLNFPTGLDYEGDIALETIKIINWFPGEWPFMVLTDRPSPNRPPQIPGYAYFFSLPGSVVLPLFVPWISVAAINPGTAWFPGFDFKLLDQDPKIGDVIRQFRLRPTAGTPQFRTEGHTHLFVLQGAVTISAPDYGSVTLKKYDYAFVPENFIISLKNPSPPIAFGEPCESDCVSKVTQ